MKQTFVYATLLLFLAAPGQLFAVTSPVSSSPTSKSTRTTSTPVKKKPPAATAPAKEPSFFDNTRIGLVLISQSLDVTSTNGGGSTVSSKTGSGLGIYLDKFYGGQYRVNGTLSYVSYDNFVISSLTFAGDYLLPLNANLAIFGGIAIGGVGQKYTNSTVGDMSLAPVYGAQLGGIIFISDNLMMEVGYRLRLTKLETNITSAPGTVENIDQMNETYLSLILSF